MPTGPSVLMLAQGMPASLSFPPGNPWKEPTPSMCRGLVSVSRRAESHRGDHEGGGSWGRHAGHKQKSATAAGRASERKSIQPTENELLLMFTEHLFRLSNMAPRFSAVGSRSPQRLLDVFWCCCSWHWPRDRVADWWGELAPPSEASSSAPHHLSLVSPLPES